MFSNFRLRAKRILNGSDGKEISVHNLSAPDHEPIQGHQFTNEEVDNMQTGKPFSDVDGISFAPIDRPIV